MAQNRDSVPGKHVLAAYWADREPAFGIDVGEPSCFACGWYREDWEPVFRAGGDFDIVATWKSVRLDVAHLVPHMLGGPEDVSNLVLLCRDCHRDAPSYRDPSVMLQWMRDRPYWTVLLARALPVDRLAELAQVPGVADAVGSAEFMKFFRANAGYSGDESRAGKVRTLFAALEEFARQHRPKRTVQVRAA